MAKLIERIPFESVERIGIVFGNGRSLAQVKGDADYIMNAGFYSTLTGKPTGHLKADGTVYAKDIWNCWGYTWDSSNIRLDVVPEKGGKNYINGVELLTPMVSNKDRPKYRAEVGGTRPRTALAMTGKELVLYCADSPCTPEELQQELYLLGAESALMLDSGGSTQCDFRGKTIASERRVNNYIAVWLKKAEDKPQEGENTMSKKVVLDPGHGVETAGKRSPDGTYLEHEFALDMAKRIKSILERHGVETKLTRETENDVSLEERVKIANDYDPDLFVSLHSNASGNGWSDPDGYGIYTSAAGETQERNKAARAILARVKEAKVSIWGDGLFHSLFYVLKNTNAPAVLIEHGFHTNMREVELLKNGAYRDLLATADSKGILDYLGIAWKEEPKESKIVCPHCGGSLRIEKGE